MAEQEQAPQQQKETKKSKGIAALARFLPAGYIQWIMIITAVFVCAGGGFGLSRLFGSSDPETKTTAPLSNSTRTQPANLTASGGQMEKGWYYELEPVVANLNEPGATRYVRAALTLEMSGELDKNRTTAFLNEKIPTIKSWITIYLAGQTIDQLRGERNLKRIQSEILDSFNEKLFPGAKQQITRVLINQFTIQ